ncbi:hypothetical protein [Clostridium neonatale]|uniref:Uncharacterized protein n=2 Tax=Clostridium neonatale TaxID=137838 RepID=A0AA86JSU9_9CLOT|nr:conserved hypothetical protein [Clostridium neonatale]
MKFKDKNLKSMYQTNRNFILGQVFNRIINLLVNAKLTRKILKIILEKSKKFTHKYVPIVLVSEKPNIQGKSIITIKNHAFKLQIIAYFKIHFNQWIYLVYHFLEEI